VQGGDEWIGDVSADPWLALARERFQHKTDLQAIKLKLFGSEVLKGMIE